MRRDPPDLHSFPTRRSSDLTSAPRPLCAWCAMMVAFLSQFGPVWACLDHLRALSIEYLEQGDLAFNQGVPRSEEHTSELQSHVNLVCRLPLEKKKEQQDLSQ